MSKDNNEEVVKILETLDEESLFNLAKTVTQGLKRSETIEDAITNIIKYSKDHLSILRRKALTKELLFDYLETSKVEVKPPKTKNELIDLILEYWGTNTSQAGQEVAIPQRGTVQIMAEQFAKWFFQMLNNRQCGVEHFFPDAKLRLNLLRHGDKEQFSVKNDPSKISEVLLNYNFTFNPNDSAEGIQGRIDPHGLVMILVCGTLHGSNTIVGVFEQVFSLARDPNSDNNWKVKEIKANLRLEDSNVVPRLCDSELMGGLLMLPSE